MSVKDDLWCGMKVMISSVSKSHCWSEQLQSAGSNLIEWWAEMWPISFSIMISASVVILCRYLGHSQAVCLRWGQRLRLRYSNLNIHLICNWKHTNGLTAEDSMGKAQREREGDKMIYIGNQNLRPSVKMLPFPIVFELISLA